MPAVETRVTIAFVFALAAMCTAGALAWHSMRQSLSISHSVDRTYEVLAVQKQVLAALDQMVAASVQYVMTADGAHLAERDAAISEVRSSLQDLRELTAADRQQQQRVRDVEQAVAERIEAMNSVISARQLDGFEAARTLLATGRTAGLLAHIRSELHAIESTEQLRLAERYAADEVSRGRVVVWVCALLAIVVATVTLGLVRLRRELRARHELAQQLGRSQRFFESVFEHIPSMVFIKEADQLRFHAFNRAGEELTGIDREALLGKTDFDLFPPEQAAGFTAADRQVIESGGLLDIPAEQLRTADGKLRVLHTRKIPILREHGSPGFLLGISEDITERIESQRRIEALNAELAGKASALQALNHELESFAYSVSHDLRAPLRAIDSFSMMLEEDFGAGLHPEAQRFVRVIREGTRRMGRLIDDLLAFSRLSRQPMRTHEIDTRSLVARAATEVLEAHAGARPELVVGELPPARGDATLLHQVWVNLIGNAVKYSSKVAAPRIEIGGSADGDEATYYVKDNGAGFDMRYADKLFGVFQRLHRDDEFPGTGVGLAIVQRVIGRHGGRVWARSEPDRGAHFFFSLPQREVA